MRKRKKRSQKRIKKVKKIKQKISWSYIFSYGNNLAINTIIVIFLICLGILIMINHRRLSLEQEQLRNIVPVNDSNNTEAVKVIMSVSNWKTYPAQWYGFELKYPESWEEPTTQNSPAGSDWEYRYLLRKKDPSQLENSCTEKKHLSIANWQWKYLFYKKDPEESNPYGGLDVVVYSVEKFKDLINSDELAVGENEELKSADICDRIKEHLLKNEIYPGKKIHNFSEEDCYNSVFLYKLNREKYVYNIAPVLKENWKDPSNLEKESIDNFPEFFSVASSFNLIDIKRPKIIPKKPRITAPKPNAATKKDALGRMICAKKNDKPGKSNQHKGKHMDMECCFDPDEYPNPWCYYGK